MEKLLRISVILEQEQLAYFFLLIFVFFFPSHPQAQGQTFTFPDIFPEKDRTAAEGSVEEMQEKFMEDEKQKQKPDPRRGGVTEWFGL